VFPGAKSHEARGGMALLVGQRKIIFMHGKIGFHDIEILHIRVGEGHVEGELVEQVRVVGVAGMRHHRL